MCKENHSIYKRMTQCTRISIISTHISYSNNRNTWTHTHTQTQVRWFTGKKYHKAKIKDYTTDKTGKVMNVMVSYDKKSFESQDDKNHDKDENEEYIPVNMIRRICERKIPKGSHPEGSFALSTWCSIISLISLTKHCCTKSTRTSTSEPLKIRINTRTSTQVLTKSMTFGTRTYRLRLKNLVSGSR